MLAGAALGETVAATAKRIGRAPATVKNHRASAQKKLQARNIAHAVGRGYSLGVLIAPTSSTPSDITDGQVRAFHAKLHELVKRSRRPKDELKEELLEQASLRCGRKIAGLHDLRSFELSDVLNVLETEIVASAVRAA